MFATGVRQDIGGVVVHHFHVGDQRSPGKQSLEEVMREQRVVGHTTFERRHKRIDVVESFSGEQPLVKEILIDVGHRRRVRIHSGVSGVGAREPRAGGTGHGHADARLQNAVTLGHAARHWVKHRPVERVRDDADQAFCRITRQLCVRVECQAVAHLGQDVGVAHTGGEAGVSGLTEQPVELLDLAAFALPAHPRAFTCVPLPVSMEQEKTIVVCRAEFGVERRDAAAGLFQQVAVVGRDLCGRIGKVAEDGEVDTRIEVAEGKHLHVFNQRVHAGTAREHCGDDHHRPGGLGDTRGGKIQPWQPRRAEDFRDESVQSGDDEVGERHHEHQRCQCLEPDGGTPRAGVSDDDCKQQQGADGDAAEIERCRESAHQSTAARLEPRTISDGRLKGRSSAIHKMEADVCAAVAPAECVGRQFCRTDRRVSDTHLIVATMRRQ